MRSNRPFFIRLAELFVENSRQINKKAQPTGNENTPRRATPDPLLEPRTLHTSPASRLTSRKERAAPTGAINHVWNDRSPAFPQALDGGRRRRHPRDVVPRRRASEGPGDEEEAKEPHHSVDGRRPGHHRPVGHEAR